MTDQREPQPDKKKKNEPPDLAKQLDDLLAQIEEAQPGVLDGPQDQVDIVMSEDSDSGTADDVTARPQVAASYDQAEAAPVPALPDDSPAQEPQAGPSDEVDVLAQQILSLIGEPQSSDTDRDSQDAGAQPSPPAAEPPSPQPAAINVAASSSPLNTADTSAGLDGEAATQIVQQIDELLAAEADGAIAAEFDTTQSVLDDPAAPPPPPTEDALRVIDEASEDSRSPSDDDAAGLAHAAQASQAARAAVEAQFADAARNRTAQRVQPEGFVATAEDVAKELDEQPEPPTQAADIHPHDAETDQKPPRTVPPIVITCRKAAFVACRAINRPLYRFPQEVRHAVGWVGLITLFNGTVLTLYGLMKAIF